VLCIRSENSRGRITRPSPASGCIDGIRPNRLLILARQFDMKFARTTATKSHNAVSVAETLNVIVLVI
jgi:hypothetical protein